MLIVKRIAGSWVAYDIWREKIVAFFESEDAARAYVDWGIES